MLLRLLSAVIAGGAALHASAGAVSSNNGRRSEWAKRAIPDTHRVHERSMPQWKAEWKKGDRLSSEVVLPVRIGLKNSNLKEGHDRLMEM
jgi:tripeptidyl-peptidase I